MLDDDIGVHLLVGDTNIIKEGLSRLPDDHGTAKVKRWCSDLAFALVLVNLC